MDKPTLSPQSNKLLEMCAGLLDNKVNAEDLWDFMEEMYEGLERARSEFIEQFEKQTHEFKEKIIQEADLVLISFDNYLEGLDCLNQYFQTKNVEDIRQGMQIIISATGDMLNGLTNYEAKSLQLGPTSFPILNMLILLSDGYKSGSVTKDEFRFMINNSEIFFNKMVEEAESYQGTDGRDAINMLREGYCKFLEGLQNLSDGVEKDNELLIEDGLQIIQDSQELIKIGYTMYNEEMFLSGPTDSPITNLLISTIKGVREGTFPKELLAENLQRYQQHMNTIRADFEAASRIPLDEEVEEEVVKTLNALDVSDEACEEIRAFLQSGNAQLLERAFQKLSTSTDMLKATSEVFDDINSREGKIACVKCGAFNEPINNNCVKCKAVLTKIPGQDSTTFAVGENGEIRLEDGSEFVMTENLYILLEGAEKVINKKAPFEEFTPILDWMEGLLNSTYEESKSIPSIRLDTLPNSNTPIHQHYMKIAEDTVGLLQLGLEEFIDAIQEMRQFQHDGDMMHFRIGIEGVLEATKKLQFVQRIGEISGGETVYDSVEETPYDENAEENYSVEDEDGESDEQTDSFLPTQDSYK
jgi:hypothetical protein